MVRAGAEHTVCTAVQCGDHVWMQKADLTQDELDVIFTADEYGNGAVPLGTHTPLTGAVFVNDPEMMNVLLDKGADLFKARDSVRHSDTTAIHQAVMFDNDAANRFPTLRTLLRHYVKLRSAGAPIPDDMMDLRENLGGERDKKRHEGGGSWRDMVHPKAWDLILNVDSYFSGGDEELDFLDDSADSLQIANLESENVLPAGAPSGSTSILTDDASPSSEPGAPGRSALSGASTKSRHSAPTSFESASAGVRRLPVVPGYTCEKLLGEGGQGSVWLARDEVTQEQVAVKVGGHALGNERHVREQKNLSLLTRKLTGHPNIVKFKSADVLDGVEVLVMAFVEGENLRERLKAVKKLKPEEAEWVMAGLLGGLSGLHKYGIAHRDVKPENIMISSQHFEKLSDRVVVVDLGLSKREESQHSYTAAGAFVGSPAYFSPEATLGKKLTMACDVWAAGVVLFEMLAGLSPFHSDTWLGGMESIRVTKTPELPHAEDALTALFRKALQKDPAARFANAIVMLEAFKEVCENPDDVPPSCKVEVVSATAAAPEPAPAKRGVRAFLAQGGTGVQVHSL